MKCGRARAVQPSMQVSGITLLELLITLAIITVLAGISLPSWQQATGSQQGSRQLGAIARAVQLARNTAISTNQQVIVCRSADATSCSGSWAQGLIVFIDSNGDRLFNSEDQLVHVVQWPNNPNAIHWRAFGNRQFLQINSLGHIDHQNGSFTWCPGQSGPEQAQQLILNSTGRMRWAIDTGGNGLREDSSGGPVACLCGDPSPDSQLAGLCL